MSKKKVATLILIAGVVLVIDWILAAFQNPPMGGGKGQITE